MIETDEKYKKNLISILVPVYNVEEYLTRCLDSIMGQNGCDLEIILIDDGSTDASGMICDEYASKDERITVIHKSNGGVTSARKEGLKKAHGEYIGFVDPDDWIEADMYKEMLRCMQKTESDLVHTDKMKEIGTNVYEVKEDISSLVWVNHNMDADFLKTVLDGRFPLVLWLNLFRHDIIKLCYDEIPDYFVNGEDYVVMTGYMLKSRRISFLSKAYYHYVKREGSIQNNADINLMVTTAKQFESLSRIVCNSKWEDILKPYLNKCFIRRMLFIINKTNLVNPIPIYIPDLQKDFIGKKIVLCGAGTIGYYYYIYLSQQREYQVVKWVDANPLSYYYKEKVYPVTDIIDSVYDIVLIAVEKKNLAVQIKEFLIHMGVPADKLYWKAPLSILDEEFMSCGE